MRATGVRLAEAREFGSRALQKGHDWRHGTCTPVVHKDQRTAFRFAVWIWLAVPLALSSCAWMTSEYPANWAPKLQHSDQVCPMIAGVYNDYGEPGPGDEFHFRERRWDRGSLIYNLLSKADDQLRGSGHVSRDVQHLIGAATHVEIAQPAPDMLQVIVWSREGNDRFMQWVEGLSVDKGDFSCGPDGLRLRSRTRWLIGGISNFFGWVSRTLNRSEDGSLVMKIGDRSFGNHVFVPIGLVQNYWIRWTPMPSGAHPEDVAG